jgi:hypothetical protein
MKFLIFLIFIMSNSIPTSLSLVVAENINGTDIVDLLTNSILKPLILPSENNYDDPEELFIINAFQSNSELEDYSSETEYSESDETTEISSTSITPETNEILEMTANYHKMRVELTNHTHTIRKQQDIIKKLEKKLRDLETSMKKRKISSDNKLNELKIKNEQCRKDFNGVFRDLAVAKKLISMEKYSRGLKRKLREFGVDNET